MKITAIDTFIVDAGWRPWTFVALRTDEGLTGYGECSDGRNPFGVAATIGEFETILKGRDPRHIEMNYQDMYRMSRQSPGGIAAKAIAGIELAMWDVKAKALGVPVHELFGGPLRERQRVYWSHCGSSRSRHHDLLGVEPVGSLESITALGREVRDKGFTALKTNIILPGEGAGTYFAGFGPGPTDQTVSPKILRRAEEQIAAFRAGTGDDVEIAIDLNFNFKPEAVERICRVLEPFNMMWVEVDMYEPVALARIRSNATMPIMSGENLFGMRGYRPYFEAGSMDIVMVDIPWNGFAESRRVAAMAESYELNVAPHNYYSHLASNIALNLCACTPNVHIMEIDIDDVPWKDDLTGGPMEFDNGYARIPTKPGWGVDLDEEVAREHEWELGRGPGYTAFIPADIPGS